MFYKVQNGLVLFKRSCGFKPRHEMLFLMNFTSMMSEIGYLMRKMYIILVLLMRNLSELNYLWKLIIEK